MAITRTPYRLEADELIVVEGDSDASLIELVNEGVRAACASVVEVIMPGCLVQPDWAEDAIRLFRDLDVAAVSLPLSRDGESVSAFGIEARWLPRRSVSARRRSAKEVTPFLHGGMFRRRVLLALDGFFDDGSIESAECEFGLAVRSLGMRVEVADEECGQVIAGPSVAIQSQPSYASGLSAGRIGQAYSQIEGSDVVIDSFIARIGHVASGLMSPATVAERLGWALGVRDQSLVRHIAARIEHAETQLHAWRASAVKSTTRKVA